MEIAETSEIDRRKHARAPVSLRYKRLRTQTECPLIAQLGAMLVRIAAKAHRLKLSTFDVLARLRASH